jgi:hypothetical protein
LDIFWSSDWTQPPLRNAKGVTTVFDLIYLKFPQETHPQVSMSLKNLRFSPDIVATQTRRMKWVTQECHRIICDSNSTKNDLINLLDINPARIKVIYPGI